LDRALLLTDQLQLHSHAMKFLLAGKFRVEEKVAEGSFSDVFSGRDIYSQQQVAVKVESVHTTKPLLLYESRVFKSLSDGVGIPKVHWYGNDGHVNILAIDRFGPTIHDLFENLDMLGVGLLLMLAKQVLDRTEFMHSKDFIHRDVKPESFSLGTDLEDKNDLNVHIIDLGLAKRYRYPKADRRHINMKRKLGYKRFSHFASHRSRQGFEQSRRDDLEAIGNMMMYLQYRELPASFMWGDIDPKVDTRASQDMWLAKLPRSFVPYVKYTQSLEFEEKPDYNVAWELLRSAIFEGNHCQLVNVMTPHIRTQEEDREEANMLVPNLARNISLLD